MLSDFGLAGVARPGRRSHRHRLPAGLHVPGAERLNILPALVRAPPVANERQTLHSMTLAGSDPGGGPVRGWAERILMQEGWFSAALEARAAAVLTQLVSARVGGTWWGAASRRSTVGRAVVFATGDTAATARMLDRAVQEHGAGRTVVVLPRPGSDRALLARCKQLGVEVLGGVLDPWPLIEEAARIHATGDSEAGMLARLLGAPLQVHTPGPLTRAASPLHLVAAAVILGARYADPFTGHPAPCEAFIDHVAAWRRRSGTNAEVACCVGISFWKRRRVTQMLGAHRAPAFRRTAARAVAEAQRRGGSVAVWASRAPAGLAAQAAAAGVPLIRMEDGFVRSVGLGADFLPPLSIVLDRIGLYYDSTGPSELESLLAESRFDPALTARAAALRARMVQGGVTKYNLSGAVAALQAPAGRFVVLVPGQVADDRSVLLGGGGAQAGLALLRSVRQAAPDAYIVYKPHPDVEAGHRAGAVPDSEALGFCDQVVRGVSMAALLDQVDAVHTLTSLTGFEALLRGKPVTTYGQPFYAGWGLTTDRNPPARRSRRLTIDALVAGTLILYPGYIDPVSLLPCGPEVVLDRLADPAPPGRAGLLVWARRLQGRASAGLRKLLQSKPAGRVVPGKVVR